MTDARGGTGDPYDLTRFVGAQESDYERALAEVKSGRKKSHWMWYIFPQVLDKYFQGERDGKTLRLLRVAGDPD